MDLDQQQSQLKLLIAKGKEQGYLTYHEVNDHLPDGIVDPEQIEDIISMINDMGIAVHETAPDEEALLLNETTAAVDDDEDAAEEAAAALATLDAEFGPCSTYGECELVCPAGIPLTAVAAVHREKLRAVFRPR